MVSITVARLIRGSTMRPRTSRAPVGRATARQAAGRYPTRQFAQPARESDAAPMRTACVDERSRLVGQWEKTDGGLALGWVVV
jgi:hypothetical protein